MRRTKRRWEDTPQVARAELRFKMEEVLLRRLDKALRDLDQAEADRQPKNVLRGIDRRIAKIRAALKRAENLPA